MSAVAAFKAITDAGLRVSVDAENLVVQPKERITPELRSLIRAEKSAIIALLKNSGAVEDCNETQAIAAEAEFEERAAIIEFEAGVPRKWAEGFARLCTMRRPRNIDPARWARLLDDAGIFIDRWAVQADELGWDTANVFGIGEAAPLTRFDQMGLVASVNGAEVIRIERDRAVVRMGSGSCLSYYRRKAPVGQALVWELLP